MADDIRIEITGDKSDLKKVIKASEKLVKRFEKVNSAATRRRQAKEKKTSDQIVKAEAQKNKRLAAMDKRLARRRARNRLKAMKNRIRIAKKEEAAVARIRTRNAARMKKIGGFGLAAIGIGGVAGLVAAAKNVAKFDLALTKMAGTQDLTVKKQMAIRDSIMDASIATGVSRDLIVEAITAIVDKSGDIELATGNIGGLGKMIRVVGEENAGAIGNLLAALSVATAGTDIDKMGAFETIIAQGDKANITIEDTARSAKKLIGAFAVTGGTTKRDFAEYMALFQTLGGIMDPAEATTGTTGFFRDIIKKSDKIKKGLGVDIYTDKTKTKLKPTQKILEEIMKATDGSLENLKKMGDAGDPIFKVFSALLIDIKKNNGELKNFERLANDGTNAADNIRKKFDRISQTSSQAFAKIGTTLTLLMDKALTGSIDEIAKAINEMVKDPEKIKEFAKAFEAIGNAAKLAIQALILLGKVTKVSGDAGAALSQVVHSKMRRETEEMQKKLNRDIAKRSIPAIEADPTLSPSEKQRIIVDINAFVDSDEGVTSGEAIVKKQQRTERGNQTTLIRTSFTSGGGRRF